VRASCCDRRLPVPAATIGAWLHGRGRPIFPRGSWRIGCQILAAMVVENKPGAGAMLAATDVLSHPTATAMICCSVLFRAVTPCFIAASGTSCRTFWGISLIASYSYAIAVSKVLPVQNLRAHCLYQAHPDAVTMPSRRRLDAELCLAKRLEKLTGHEMRRYLIKARRKSCRNRRRTKSLYVGPGRLSVLPMYASKEVNVLAVTGRAARVHAGVPRSRRAESRWSPMPGSSLCRSGTPPGDRRASQPTIGEDRHSGGLRALIEKSGLGCCVFHAAGTPAADLDTP